MRALLIVVILGGCVSPRIRPGIPTSVDLSQFNDLYFASPEGPLDVRAALEFGLSWWSEVGVDLIPDCYNCPMGIVVDVKFHPNPSPIGFYDPITGRISFEIDWLLNPDKNSDPTTSLTIADVIAHEIGHGLGLEHITDPNSVMFESMHPSRGLSKLDIKAFGELR